jgi:hypothetical protein
MSDQLPAASARRKVLEAHSMSSLPMVSSVSY